jgi:MFS transporter, DHA1 family, multidrug resistance protein
VTPPGAQRVLVPLGLGTAVSLLGDSTLYTVLPQPEIAAQVGVTLAMVGVLLGVNRAVRLAFNGMAGVLYDRLPRRNLLISALAVGALSTLLFAVGRGFAVLLLARVLWGAAWSGIWVGGNAMVLDVAGEGERGRLLGQHQMWFFLGSGATALAGGVMTDLWGFRGGLVVSGGLTMLAAAMWLWLLPETRPAVPAATGAVAAVRMPRAAFPWRAAVPAAIPLFTVRMVFAGVMVSTTILWLTGFVGASLTLATWVVPIATLTGAFALGRSLVGLISAPVAGHLSDRAGRRWPLLAGAMAVAGAGAWLMGVSGTVPALAGALLAWTAAGSAQALVPALAGDRVTTAQRGRAMSVIYTLGDLGSALGPPMALLLVGHLPIGDIYRLCAGLLALTAGYAAWQAVREPRPGRAALG